MKYEIGDLLFADRALGGEHYIVKFIDYCDVEEEYTYVLYNITDNETEYISTHWVEKWAIKVE